MYKYRNKLVQAWKFSILILSIFLLVKISSGCTNKENESLSVGGFLFGSSKQDAIQIAKSKGYDIELNGDYHLYLTGEINALDIFWDKMDICVDPVNGIKEIRLTRKNSTSTPELKSKVFNSILKRFPSSEQKSYVESLTGLDINTGKTTYVESDYANLFDIADEKDEYCGSSYYILSKDEFSTVVGKTHVKDWLNN